MDRGELVRRYVKYRDEKAKIKARQRDELAHELRPFLRDVGEAVIARQQSGDSVDVILDALGSQNKTFMYEAKAEYQRAPQIAPSTPQEVAEPAAAGELEFTVHPGDLRGEFAVLIYKDGNIVDEYVIDTDADGAPIVPDEWATHDAERRALYKKILKEIS